MIHNLIYYIYERWDRWDQYKFQKLANFIRLFLRIIPLKTKLPKAYLDMDKKRYDYLKIQSHLLKQRYIPYTGIGFPFILETENV